MTSKRQTPPTDPLHAKTLELCQDLQEHTQRLRDYATTPGNAWLAKTELQQATQLMTELESVLDEIKRVEEAA